MKAKSPHRHVTPNSSSNLKYNIQTLLQHSNASVEQIRSSYARAPVKIKPPTVQRKQPAHPTPNTLSIAPHLPHPDNRKSKENPLTCSHPTTIRATVSRKNRFNRPDRSEKESAMHFLSFYFRQQLLLLPLWCAFACIGQSRRRTQIETARSRRMCAAQSPTRSGRSADARVENESNAIEREREQKNEHTHTQPSCKPLRCNANANSPKTELRKEVQVEVLVAVACSFWGKIGSQRGKGHVRSLHRGKKKKKQQWPQFRLKSIEQQSVVEVQTKPNRTIPLPDAGLFWSECTLERKAHDLSSITALSHAKGPTQRTWRT